MVAAGPGQLVLFVLVALLQTAGELENAGQYCLCEKRRTTKGTKKMRRLHDILKMMLCEILFEPICASDSWADATWAVVAFSALQHNRRSIRANSSRLAEVTS